MNEITIGELRALVPVLQKLSKENLPVRTSFRLGKLVKELQENLDLVMEKTKEVTEKYTTGEPETDENGDTFFALTPEQITEVEKELEELDKEIIKFSAEKINLDDIDMVYLTAVETILLEPIINI